MAISVVRKFRKKSLNHDSTAVPTQCVNTTQCVAKTEDMVNSGTCQYCSQTFLKKVTWQKFCSEECRLSFHGISDKGAFLTKKKIKRIGTS
jgi:hypothetical protein